MIPYIEGNNYILQKTTSWRGCARGDELLSTTVRIPNCEEKFAKNRNSQIAPLALKIGMELRIDII